MALKRKSPDAASSAWPEPPADMLTTSVERWITPAQIAAHTFEMDCPVCVVPGWTIVPRHPFPECSSTLRQSALRVQRQARDAWLKEHDIPRADHDLLWPRRGPDRSRVGPS